MSTGPRSGPSSILTKVQTPGVERLDHLVDRLFAEVGDRVELRLGLGDQVADRLDAGALEAVVGAHAELELLDQDPVLLALQRRLRTACDREAVAVELAARGGAQLLDAVGVGEDRELRDQ